jgi:hypothetical protein
MLRSKRRGRSGNGNCTGDWWRTDQPWHCLPSDLPAPTICLHRFQRNTHHEHTAEYNFNARITDLTQRMHSRNCLTTRNQCCHVHVNSQLSISKHTASMSINTATVVRDEEMEADIGRLMRSTRGWNAASHLMIAHLSCEMA